MLVKSVIMLRYYYSAFLMCFKLVVQMFRQTVKTTHRNASRPCGVKPATFSVRGDNANHRLSLNPACMNLTKSSKLHQTFSTAGMIIVLNQCRNQSFAATESQRAAFLTSSVKSARARKLPGRQLPRRSHCFNPVTVFYDASKKQRHTVALTGKQGRQPRTAVCQ